MECSICSRVSNFNFDSNYGQDMSPTVCKVLEISAYPGYFNTTSLCFFCLQKIDQVQRLFREMDEIKLKLSTTKIEFEDDLIRTHKLNKNKPYGRQAEKRKKIIKEICSRSKGDSDMDMDNSSSLTDPDPVTKKGKLQSFSVPKPTLAQSQSKVPTLSLEQNHECESDTDFEDLDQNQNQGQVPADSGSGVINDDYQEVIPTPPIVFEDITFEGLNKLHQNENKTFSSTLYCPPVPSSSSSFQQFRENNDNNNNKSQKKAKYTIKSGNFCKDCNLVFTSDHLMNQHQKQYHSNKVNQTCMENNSEMTESDDVSVIYESEPISSQNQTQSQSQQSDENVRIGSGSRKFECQYCHKRYFYRDGLRVHIGTVHQNIRFPCHDPACSEEFTRKSTMLQHVRRYHPTKALICPIQVCSKIFVDPDLYKTHVLEHNNQNKQPRVFGCNLCSRTFTENKNLARHLDSHNETPYPCPHCDAKYFYLSSLSRHVKFKHLLNISSTDLKKYSNCQ